MKAELQKTKQDLAAETGKSTKLNNQINVLCAHACKLTNRYYAALTSKAALEEAYKDVACDLRAYKGTLDIVTGEFKESREDNDLLHNLLDKRDDELELLTKQLKEAKEESKEAKEESKVLTSMFKLLGEDHEVGRAVYYMLLLHVEGQYGEDKVVVEKMKKALEEAFGGSLGNKSE
jgi:chromosome segregation ATPase